MSNPFDEISAPLEVSKSALEAARANARALLALGYVADAACTAMLEAAKISQVLDVGGSTNTSVVVRLSVRPGRPSVRITAAGDAKLSVHRLDFPTSQVSYEDALETLVVPENKGDLEGFGQRIVATEVKRLLAALRAQ